MHEIQQLSKQFMEGDIDGYEYVDRLARLISDLMWHDKHGQDVIRLATKLQHAEN